MSANASRAGWDVFSTISAYSVMLPLGTFRTSWFGTSWC
jgi:hypothetical protein